MRLRRASWIPSVLLLGASCLLLGLDRSLEKGEASARDMRDRIGRLVRKEERDKIEQVAAVSIFIGEREKYTYAKVDDRWRILDGKNTPADPEAIERLWKSLLDGEGFVHSSDATRLAQYGFSTANVIRVELHGPQMLKKKDKDVRYRCELGNRIPELDGCFVRRANDSSVWSIGSDPRGIIESSRIGFLPPLAEGTLVSRAWMQSGAQVETVTIESNGKPPLVLKLEQLQVDMEEMKKGKDPFRWTATVGGAPVTVDSRTTMSYFSTLMSGKATATLEPASAAADGIDIKAAATSGETRITFAPAAGKGTSCTFVLSAARKDGSRVLWNTESKVLFVVDPELSTLFVPTPAELATAGNENKWQHYLGRQQQAAQPQSIENPPGPK